MTFPDKKYPDIASFTDDYFEKYAVAAASIDRKKLAEAGDMLEAAYQRGATAFIRKRWYSLCLRKWRFCGYFQSSCL